MSKDEKKVVKSDSKSKKTKKNNFTSKSKKEKHNAPKENYFKKVRKELKLVKWPTSREVLKYTISTIVFCLVLCVMFMLLNLGLSIVKGWFV